MFQLVSTIIMWTVGVIILSQGNGTSWKKSLGRFESKYYSYSGWTYLLHIVIKASRYLTQR